MVLPSSRETLMELWVMGSLPDADCSLCQHSLLMYRSLVVSQTNMYKGDIKHHTFHSHVIYVIYFPFPCYICHILSISMLYMSYTFYSHVIYVIYFSFPCCMRCHVGFRLLPVYYELACFYGSSDPIQDIGCERDTNLPITRYDPTPDIGRERDANLPSTRYDPTQDIGCERVDTNLPSTRYDPTPDIGRERVDTNLPITRYDPIQDVKG